MARFDPYETFVWQPYDAAFEHGGQEAAQAAVEAKEAPLGYFIPDHELAGAVAAAHGLQSNHLRFAVLPDAMPAIAPREPGEPEGIHLNVIGARQVPFYRATQLEQAVVTDIMSGIARHLDEKFTPESGIALSYFGNQVPTLHGHVIPRLKPADGVNHWTARSVEAPTPLASRQAMRDRVGLHISQLAELQDSVIKVLERYA